MEVNEDCIENGHFDRSHLGNLYAARDAIDAAREQKP